MKYVFGPVASRRLGLSLGIDIVPYKTCTLDCVYCECGKTTNKTIKRENYFPIDDIIKDIKKAVNTTNIDVITFSGSGEPTLYLNLKELVKKIKKITDKPLVMITNSTLLYKKDVFDSLLMFDFVLPSLDAVTKKNFLLINKPHNELKIEKIIESLIEFSKIFRGKLWLEILFCKGINDTKEEINALKHIISKIKTDKIQVNSVDRPPAYLNIQGVEYDKLKEIAYILKGEVIVRNNEINNIINTNKDIEKKIISLLKRRPETIAGLSNSLGINSAYLSKILENLEHNNIIKKNQNNQNIFYRLVNIK